MARRHTRFRQRAEVCSAFTRCPSGNGRSRPPRSIWRPAVCARSRRSERRPSPPAPHGWRRRTANWSACPRLPACRGSPARWPRRSANSGRPAFRRRRSWTTTVRETWGSCSSASPTRWSGSDWPTVPRFFASPSRPSPRDGRSCPGARSGSTSPCAAAPRPACWKRLPRAAGRSWRPSPPVTASPWSG